MRTAKAKTTKAGKIVLWMILMILLSSIVALSTVTALTLNNENIYENIWIENIDVGNLSKYEAKERLKEVFDKELDELYIVLKYKEYQWQRSYKDLGWDYLYDEAIESAYSKGREGSIRKRMQQIYALKKEPKIIQLEGNLQIRNFDDLLEEIKEKVNVEPEEASIKRENSKFIITKEKLGIALQEYLLKNQIIDHLKNFEQQEIYIPTEYTAPSLTEEMLKTITDIVGEFTTSFSLTQTNRNINIAIAAESVNGILLMPGESFSFSERTGPWGTAQGYKSAPVIVNGQLQPGIGGGICQVATTLYNAVIRADLEVSRRRNHSLPVNYVPLGQDAAVAYGHLDFEFINDLSTPLYLEGNVKGNEVIIKIHGKRINDYVITLHSTVVETIEPSVEIRKSENLYQGEKKTEREAKRGYRVDTYKIYSQDGREIQRKHISRDYYPPVNGIVIEGTKIAASTSNPIQQETPLTQQPIGNVNEDLPGESNEQNQQTEQTQDQQTEQTQDQQTDD